MPGREFMSRTKPTRNCSAKRRHRYCRIKKKPHKEKLFLDFIPWNIYHLNLLQFYMMHSS